MNKNKLKNSKNFKKSSDAFEKEFNDRQDIVTQVDEYFQEGEYSS
jgi:hypothetical protein